MGWGLAAAMGGGLLGGLGSAFGGNRAAKKAAALQDRRIRQGLGFLDRGEGQIREGFADAEGAQRQAIGTLEQGVMRALASLDDGFGAEVRRVMDERAQAQASLEQDMASRGLHGSTAAMSFQRALGSDAQRAIGDIQARFAGARSDTFLQGAGMVGQAQQGLAGLFAGRGQALSNVQGQRASLLGQAPIPVHNNAGFLGQLGALGLQGYGIHQAGKNNDALTAALNSLAGRLGGTGGN